ncbi:MAG: DUF72 domain-containing protein [Gammaproteobacteria bacterium]|nr:DUF72 domain-containing protein [Gammaproteobacteria bacterium]MDH4254129.1 DUF72 domain-containing protein [Gammaproteobacteria bacterium]MDH5309504.1 DUF72 domain-containing protein [Gammaproteobacteria bacterium]
MTTPELPYRLGLPAWAFPAWRGRYFEAQPSALAGYASVFNTVEGNTTFYQVPAKDTVAAWREAVQGTDFRFCFKLPRTVTHDRSPDFSDLERFLSAVEPLADHVGPLLLQFPARVGPEQLDELQKLLTRLPAGFDKVLEFRHPRLFSEPELVDDLLQEFGCGRVVLDTRPIYAGDRRHPEVIEALHEKPDLPVLQAVYNRLEFVRLVLHPDRLEEGRYIDEWADRIAMRIGQGVSAWMMIHCPNNLHCPEMARAFHAALGRRLDGLPPLPPWPVPQQATLL